MWKIGLKWEASFDIRIIIQLNYICIFKRGSLCRLLKFGREIGTATCPLYPIVLLVNAATELRVKGTEPRPCPLMREIPSYLFPSETQTAAVPQSNATKSPTLRAAEVLHVSFCPYPAVCLELSQDRYCLKWVRDNFSRNWSSAIGVLLGT